MSEERPKKKRKKKATAEEGGDEPKEHKLNWRETYATVEEINQFLSGHIYLRQNVVTGRTECRVPSDYDTDGTDWQPISDRAVNSLWAELSKEKAARIHRRAAYRGGDPECPDDDGQRGRKGGQWTVRTVVFPRSLRVPCAYMRYA